MPVQSDTAGVWCSICRHDYRVVDCRVDYADHPDSDHQAGDLTTFAVCDVCRYEYAISDGRLLGDGHDDSHLVYNPLPYGSPLSEVEFIARDIKTGIDDEQAAAFGRRLLGAVGYGSLYGGGWTHTLSSPLLMPIVRLAGATQLELVAADPPRPGLLDGLSPDEQDDLFRRLFEN